MGEIWLNVDILIYVIGAILMACISIGFVLWGLKTGQFRENEHLKSLPLEEDEEEHES
jgi:cbb3-type cytochrome oxidase maturation protein